MGICELSQASEILIKFELILTCVNFCLCYVGFKLTIVSPVLSLNVFVNESLKTIAKRGRNQHSAVNAG